MDQNRSLGLGLGVCYLVTATAYTILVWILYAHTYLSLWIMLSLMVGIVKLSFNPLYSHLPQSCKYIYFHFFDT